MTFGVEAYGVRSYGSEIKFQEILRLYNDGNLQIEDTYITNIAPFNLSNIKDFNPSYFTSVMHANFNDTLCEEKIQEPIKDFIRNQIKKRINLVEASSESSGYNSKIEAIINQIDKMKLFVPVWYAKLEYEGETYEIIINDTNNNNHIFNYNAARVTKSSIINYAKNNKISLLGYWSFLLLIGTFIISFFKSDSLNLLIVCLWLATIIITLFITRKNSDIMVNYKKNNTIIARKLGITSNVELLTCNIEFDRKTNCSVENKVDRFIFK